MEVRRLDGNSLGLAVLLWAFWVSPPASPNIRMIVRADSKTGSALTHEVGRSRTSAPPVADSGSTWAPWRTQACFHERPLFGPYRTPNTVPATNVYQRQLACRACSSTRATCSPKPARLPSAHSPLGRPANEFAGCARVSAVPSTWRTWSLVGCIELTSRHEGQHSKKRTESPGAGCLLVYKRRRGVLRRRCALLRLLTFTEVSNGQASTSSPSVHPPIAFRRGPLSRPGAPGSLRLLRGRGAPQSPAYSVYQVRRVGKATPCQSSAVLRPLDSLSRLGQLVTNW